MEPQMQGTKVGLMKVGELLRATWKTYWERFSVFALIMGVPIVLLALSALLNKSILLSVLLMLGAGIAYVIAYIALALGALKSMSVKEAYREAFGAMFGYLWVAALINLINIGGFILGVIPGFIFSVWFAFAPFIFLTEGKKGIDALVASKRYVKGLWWPIFGRMVLAGFAVSLLNGVVVKLGEGSGSTIVVAAIPLVMQFVLVPLSVVFVAKLFEDLKTVNRVENGEESGKKWMIGIMVFALVAITLLLFGASLAGFERINTDGLSPEKILEKIG